MTVNVALFLRAHSAHRAFFLMLRLLAHLWLSAHRRQKRDPWNVTARVLILVCDLDLTELVNVGRGHRKLFVTNGRVLA